ncbi:MAG TPA: hypothetical protein VFS42_05475 [Burkholderiaceae bacterium]|nr:hypothetical protein [Burkholderiaceae bacterium]
MASVFSLAQLETRDAPKKSSHAWRRYAALIVLTLGLAACGGGGSAEDSATNVDPASSAANSNEATSVKALAQSVDAGATGNPISVVIKRTGNGDAFVVWRAFDGTRHNLWFNRYDVNTRQWGTAALLNLADQNITGYDLGTDGRGNAFVIASTDGPVYATRYNASKRRWDAEPKKLADVGGDVHIAADFDGNAMAIFSGMDQQVTAVYYASQRWMDPVAIGINYTGSGVVGRPNFSLDFEGDAMAVWLFSRVSTSTVHYNTFNHKSRQWLSVAAPVSPTVPGSAIDGANENLQVSADSNGDFFLAWQAYLNPMLTSNPDAVIKTSFFSRKNQTWSQGQIVIPKNQANDVRLKRALVIPLGNPMILWTQTEGSRVALHSKAYDGTKKQWQPTQIVDEAIGGNVTSVDLDFDYCGGAYAVWLQNEGSVAGTQARSNVAGSRYKVINGKWTRAKLLEDSPGTALSPRVTLDIDGKGFAAWIQEEGGAFRVKVSRLN